MLWIQLQVFFCLPPLFCSLPNSKGTLWPRDSSLQALQKSDAMDTASSVLLFASFVCSLFGHSFGLSQTFQLTSSAHDEVVSPL
jgi:hypothetical protein